MSGDLHEDPGSNSEDDEMRAFKLSALSVVKFQIVFNKTDFDAPPIGSNSFAPEMAHQIFGEQEIIYGYREATIKLYYLHNSAKCYVDWRYKDRAVVEGSSNVDQVMNALNDWLPENYTRDRDTFLKEIQAETHHTMYGEVLDRFDGENGRSYKISLCDVTDPLFKEFHQRFETFIPWFIDGANFIDMEDSRWMIYYVFEEFVDKKTKQTYRSPIAFCTVYRFFLYPSSIRTRISQFFVLPTHQRKSIGSKLYTTVFNHLKGIPEVSDITVEEPTMAFQKIRDFCDSYAIYRHLDENQISIDTTHEKNIALYLKKHKLCKRQSQRVLDILGCLAARRRSNSEYIKFTNDIKERVKNKIEKETRGSKRICNLERVGIITEPSDKAETIAEECTKYIDSLDWPVSRLKGYLRGSAN